ncbi:MAG: glucosamine inositolphosphorylceramide transferase family protein, partial [Hyphomicrobium sp.]
VDARSTRPAGPLWMDGAHLIRPTQDCSTGYGGQVTLNRIERLDEGAFAETAIGTIAFDAGLNVRGPHTVVRGAGLELIDLYARPSALRAGYRGPNSV